MKQRYIILLPTIFALCCWTQASSGMKNLVKKLDEKIEKPKERKKSWSVPLTKTSERNFISKYTLYQEKDYNKNNIPKNILPFYLSHFSDSNKYISHRTKPEKVEKRYSHDDRLMFQFYDPPGKSEKSN